MYPSINTYTRVSIYIDLTISLLRESHYLLGCAQALPPFMFSSYPFIQYSYFCQSRTTLPPPLKPPLPLFRSPSQTNLMVIESDGATPTKTSQIISGLIKSLHPSRSAALTILALAPGRLSPEGGTHASQVSRVKIIS